MLNESPNEFFVKAGWAAMWNPKSDYYLPNVIKNGISKKGVKVDALGNLELGDVPSSGSFQLMKSDNLASWLPVKTGYVGIKFSNVEVSNINNVTNGGLTYTNASDSKGKISAKIGTPSISITGKYQLVATGLAECALDTAAVIPGGLTSKKMATEVGDSNGFLDTARTQRTKLWQTKNGGQFMDSYYDHNEVFNFTFQKNIGLKNSWKEPANQHFMNTTNEAAKNPDNDVNTGTYTSESKSLGDDDMTYNKNAFNQKIAVANAAFGYSINPPSGTNITTQQFSDAANAAMNFQNIVGDTGNTSDKTKAMSVSSVFKTIGKGEQTKRMAMKNAPMDYKTFIASLTDDEKAYLKKMDVTDEKSMLKSDNDASATLLTGTFQVNMSSGDLTLDADLDFQTEPELKATATVNSFSSDIKVTQVEIHNMNVGWLGLKSIGSKLIEAYNNSSQIESLMQDKIKKELESDKVKNYIASWINTTFQKLLGAF